MFGRRIVSLADKYYLAGRHTISWNGKNKSGKKIGHGIYLINLTAGKEYCAKRMIFN
jgi:flagellar hook assembly protein FlgD